MPASGFVHLHTHSEYSLLDGAARLDALVQRAVELEMPALALTDHGVMYGAVDFYEKCKKAGIKPILGVEAYIAPGHHKERTQKGGKANYHLVLLAENSVGYRNLVKLTTFGAVEGFYMKPRIDREVLAAHSEGVIATSACLSGEISVALLDNDYERARDIAAFYRELFGRERFYIEVQQNGLPRQEQANEGLIRIARELGLGLVCTNDIHYLSNEDAYAHDVLLCIGTATTVNDPNRMRYDSDQFYMKTPEEMQRAFSDLPEAVANTLDIAERCTVEIEFGRAPMPAPGIPSGRSAQQYLEELAYEGLQRKLPEAAEQYQERLRHELSIIGQTGFSQYILIVRDFALFARDKGIYFGVRGSAAGSLVSFCVDITDIDPVDYELTFERFLNPERIQMPDIDMDFEDTRRSEVIEYVTGKYGKDHVAQIVTFGTLAAKAAIKDTGRALGMPLGDVNRIAAMIPTMPLHVTIKDALKTVDELRGLMQRDPDVRRLLETAMRLEGVSRHSSVHAAGVVISHDPLVDYTPLQRSADGGFITQYSATTLDHLGLLKMDFLGLINLSILGRAIENIRKTTGEAIDIHRIPLDDESAFALLGRGETTGVFQLESDGMRRNVVELRPNSVRELAAMIALYRPGPLAHIPTFIRAKHGLEPIRYAHSRLEPILKETYGVIVYQDQVLRIAQAIAGYSLGRADILRRAMGKKKKEEMAKERTGFIEGATGTGLTGAEAGAIFDLIEPFAGYAFNKAHAVCYAMVAYQTAYLKAHYPVEYMTALLACFIEKTDKVATCLAECARMRIRVVRPDVNSSDADFSAENDCIRFGLAAVKNVGRAAVDIILAARADGAFRSLTEFCRRIQQHGTVTRATIEALIQCGALDGIHPNRRAMVEALDGTTRVAAQLQRDRERGQESLFGGDDAARQHDGADEDRLPDVPDYPHDQLLAMERDLLGFYLSGHPLDKYEQQFGRQARVRVSELQEMQNDDPVTVGGIITNVRPFVTKTNREQMAYVTLEDLTGQVAVTVFPRTFRDYGAHVAKDRVVLLKGRISSRERLRDDDEGERAIEILAEEITPIGNGANGAGLGSMNVRLEPARSHLLGVLRAAIEKHPGATPIYFHVSEGGSVRKVRGGMTIELCDDLRSAVEQMVGRQSVWVE